CLGLGDGPGKAVEEKAVAGLVGLHSLEDHLDDDLVGDQLSLLHVLLGLVAQVGSVPDRLAQEIAGDDVGQAEVFAQAFALRALTRPGRAEQDEVEFGHARTISGSPRSCASSAAPRAASWCPAPPR